MCRPSHVCVCRVGTPPGVNTYIPPRVLSAGSAPHLTETAGLFLIRPAFSQFHFFVVDYATTLAASVLTSVTVTLPQRDAPHSDEVELLTADAAPNDL